jgi:hypothetical protein
MDSPSLMELLQLCDTTSIQLVHEINLRNAFEKVYEVVKSIVI